jgi:hypothetical protein
MGFVLVAACGSGAAQAPQPAPVTPREAAISITGSFTPFQNQYGDQLEALNLHITSNVPVPFRVFIESTSGPGALLHNGSAEEKCMADSGCLVSPRAAALDDYYCDNACPSGTYVFDAWACSYNSDEFFNPCRDQPAEYLAFVGKLGQNLKGNPNAKADGQHPAILNLTASASVVHP